MVCRSTSTGVAECGWRIRRLGAWGARGVSSIAGASWAGNANVTRRLRCGYVSPLHYVLRWRMYGVMQKLQKQSTVGYMSTQLAPPIFPAVI